MQPDFDKSAAAMVAGANKAIAAAVAPLLKRIEQLEARPLPERGEKGEPGQPGERGRDGAPGREGVGVAGAVIDRDGVLILTLSDGTTRGLGVVVGKDGADGRDGTKGDQGDRGEKGETGQQGERGERGSDGADGHDGANGEQGPPGRDGFNLEDFDCEPVDERTIKLMFTRGDVMHSFELEFPVIVDRGVFKVGEDLYHRGDAVTWGGSLWIAQRETREKPDSPDSGWRLAVKKGRDGKDAKDSK